MYSQLFQYLKDELDFEPYIINLPLHEQLNTSLKTVFPETILLGWYNDLIKDIFLCKANTKIKSKWLKNSKSWVLFSFEKGTF